MTQDEWFDFLTSNGEWPIEVILRGRERRAIAIRAFYARLEPWGA